MYKCFHTLNCRPCKRASYVEDLRGQEYIIDKHSLPQRQLSLSGGSHWPYQARENKRHSFSTWPRAGLTDMRIECSADTVSAAFSAAADEGALLRFAASPALPAPKLLDAMVQSDCLTAPILSLLLQCLCSLSAEGKPSLIPPTKSSLASAPTVELFLGGSPSQYPFEC